MNEHDATELVTGLYDRWFAKLVHYALRMTGNYGLAEDLAQDAFMQLYAALRAGKDIEQPKAWTLCVLRRAMNRRLKDQNRYEQLEDAEAAGKLPPDSSSQFNFAEIHILLSILSLREQEVLLLRPEAMTYREISGQLGISVSSVNSLLARAIRKLQKALPRKRKETGNEDTNQKTVGTS